MSISSVNSIWVSTLTEDSIDRYLDPATGEVQFSYEGGAGNDNFTIDVDGDLAADIDFAMDVAMGAGDDRLNLGVGGDGKQRWRESRL